MSLLASRRFGIGFLTAGALAFASCSVHSGKSRLDGPNYGDSEDMGSTDPGTDSPDLAMGSIDPGTDPNAPCSEQKFVPQKIGDPDIILLQDTSGSMADSPSGQSMTKYDITVKALDDAITQLEQAMAPIYWGLVIFPTDNDCGVNTALPVPVGPMNGQKVIASIKTKGPGGNTPVFKAVDTAVAYYDTLKDGRGHFLLLATDGEPNCDTGSLPAFCQKDADCPAGQKCNVPLPGFLGVCEDPSGGAAGKSIANALKKGIKTFVVGIDLGGDSAALDQMATQGGTARPGSPKYYPASDVNALEMALKTITSQIISCSFQLQSLPMSNQEIVVTISGAPVAQDTMHKDGWDLDATTKTLTFYGNTCNQLQANPGTVSVGFTCPPPGARGPEPIESAPAQ